jgi:hypothetical protein
MVIVVIVHYTFVRAGHNILKDLSLLDIYVADSLCQSEILFISHGNGK